MLTNRLMPMKLVEVITSEKPALLYWEHRTAYNMLVRMTIYHKILTKNDKDGNNKASELIVINCILTEALYHV